MRTLAIETSCDDTSLAVVVFADDTFVVEKILAYTQTKEHQKRWGVVPELAARTHAEKILVILDELALDWSTIDTISVTAYPGLPWALVVGVTAAYTLGSLHNKPVIEVNHIMGHVFSVLVERSPEVLQFPYVCLTVSGGHNDLYMVKNKTWKVEHDEQLIPNDIWQITPTKHNHLAIWQSLDVWPYTVTKLGQTIDDASGEVFDKVARMLWGPYPGGKWIGDEAALRPQQVTKSPLPVFHAARLPDQPYNFSFSGIKGQIYQQIENGQITITTDEQKQAVAYAFQEEVTDVLVDKLKKAVRAYDAKTIGVVWWVSANLRLREKITTDDLLWACDVLLPTKFVYCTDNAAMIGVVGLIMATTP